MDDAMNSNDVEASPKAMGLLSWLGVWASRIKAASPSAVASRLRLDAEASVVAGQIMRSLFEDAERSDENLQAAWDTFGPGPFKVAVSQNAWSIAVLDSNVLGTRDVLLVPAEAVAMMSHPGWTERLGSMVPASQWSRRTKTSVA